MASNQFVPGRMKSMMAEPPAPKRKPKRKPAPPVQSAPAPAAPAAPAAPVVPLSRQGPPVPPGAQIPLVIRSDRDEAEPDPGSAPAVPVSTEGLPPMPDQIPPRDPADQPPPRDIGGEYKVFSDVVTPSMAAAMEAKQKEMTAAPAAAAAAMSPGRVDDLEEKIDEIRAAVIEIREMLEERLEPPQAVPIVSAPEPAPAPAPEPAPAPAPAPTPAPAAEVPAPEPAAQEEPGLEADPEPETEAEVDAEPEAEVDAEPEAEVEAEIETVEVIGEGTKLEDITDAMLSDCTKSEMLALADRFGLDLPKSKTKKRSDIRRELMRASATA